MKRQHRRPAARKDPARRSTAGKPPVRTGDLFELALQHHQAGQWAEAEALYREVLALDSGHAGALHYLGVLAYQVGQLEVARELIAAARELRPEDAEIRNNLGTVLWHQRKPAEAAAEFERALALKPGYAEAHNNLANALKDLGRTAEAVAHYEQALRLRPVYAEAHNNLGSALQSLGRLEEALAHYQQALRLRANYPEAHNNAGNARLRQGQLSEAIAHYEQALKLLPDYPEALNNLGGALVHQGRLTEAGECFERAIALKPDFAGALNNLGGALQSQGRLEEATASFERAVALNPSYEEAHRNLVYTQLYRPGVGLAEIRTAAERWNAIHIERFRAVWPDRRPAPPAATGRRPKLGFVSGDFRSHVVGRLMLPVLEALSRAGHEFACYANSVVDDALTARFRAAAALWRPIAGLSDGEASAQIRADGIEILIDLSGYTADNRLLVFARRPAPLQLTWLGYPATTGMAAMDYLLADHVQVPEESDRHYREKIIRLPAGYHLYRPIDEAPEVGSSPAARNGFVTFGSFNGVQKLTAPAIEVWSRILHRLPAARLVLKAPGFNDPAVQRRYRALFAAQGIGAERLEVLGRTSPAEHMRAMTETDIALDSLPYTGGATTVDTLWMGVPVITLAGETMAGRLSAGYLDAIGLSELTARSPDHYADLAVALASDPARLASLRSGLRPRMTASPLCDEGRFVRSFEAACTAIWSRHCAGEAPAAVTIPPGL